MGFGNKIGISPSLFHNQEDLGRLPEALRKPAMSRPGISAPRWPGRWLTRRRRER